MIVRKPLPGERWMLYSPIGLRLLDDVTGKNPFGPVTAFLDRQTPTGSWFDTKIQAVMTPSGYVTYPGLERHPEILGGARRYRCRIEAEFYEPLYRANVDGIEFDAFPYNDTNPPANFPPPPNLPLPQDVVLTPASSYPFPANVRVLRGRVVDVNGDVVADAIVSQGVQERVVTDERGVFALPLRWVPVNTNIFIDASHPRTLRTGSIPILFPDDLRENHDISI